MQPNALLAKVQPDDKVVAFPYERDADGAILLNPDRIRPLPNQPRKVFRRIPELAESIRTCGQHEPGRVILLKGEKDFDAELVDGERRLRACRLIGVKFRAWPESGIKDQEEQFERSFIANFGKEDHDCIEIAHSIKRMMTKRNRSLKEIAMMAGKSITWAFQHLSLLNLHEDVQKMLVPGENEDEDSERRLTFSLAQLLVKFPQEKQVQAALKISKDQMGIVKARRYILQLARDTGIKVVSHERRPHAQFQSLMNLSEKLRDSVGVFLDMNDRELDGMMEGVHPESKVTLLERLVEFDNELVQLIEVLTKKVGKTLKKPV
jgi:ParB/RepB/Spo0J family partition protein